MINTFDSFFQDDEIFNHSSYNKLKIGRLIFYENNDGISGF